MTATLAENLCKATGECSATYYLDELTPPNNFLFLHVSKYLILLRNQIIRTR